MEANKPLDVTRDIEAPLRQWRIQILNRMLVVGCLVGLPAIVLVVNGYLHAPEDKLRLVFVGLYAVLVGLAVLRRLDSRLRAWGLLLVIYAVGAVGFAQGGLVGAGRDFLLVLPILAVILVDLRSAILMAVLSLLTMVVFAWLAQAGILAAWMTGMDALFALRLWVSVETFVAVPMVLALVLLSLFHRLQLKTLADAHRTASELSQAQALLQEQNQTLEEHVARRTAELMTVTQQRTAELEMTNSVQQGLASKLDMHAIYELAGYKIRDIFDAPTVVISEYDPVTDLGHMRFVLERGQRFYPEPSKPGGIVRELIHTLQPVLLRTQADFERYGSKLVPGMDAPLSAVFVPLIVGGEFKGAISLQDLERENAYNESDMRFLMTLANSLSIALENARLFAETQHLLAESERRARELAIINAVGQALASKLETQAIYDLVGDKLRDIFDAQVVSLMTYDRAANLVHYRYLIEKGERQFVPPRAPAGFSGHILKTCEPLLLNQVTDELRARYGSRILTGSSVKSWLGVPLVRSDQAIGVITLQNGDRENAFSEADTRLLKTLSLNMSVVLENARLFDQERERAAELVTAVTQLQQEIAERKRMEEAVQESHRQLADIIDFMPDSVLVIDREGKVLAWNRAIEEMTGTKAQEMLGKGNYEYALPFYGERRPILIDLVTMPRKELEQKYTAIRMEGQVLVGETYVPHLKGGGVYLLGTASALHDSKGNVVGAIEVIRDFTERKHMEEALHQAKESAEAATQAKSAFLATMSHEIRTPMNAVIGMTGLLLDTPLTPEQREFAETIRTSGDSLLTIINDILDFSKIEAGRMELESQPFDLRECVESAVDLLAARATEKGLDLGCVVASDVPAAILGDVTRLRQILVNLLGNAVKFTEKGEVVVTVTSDQNAETRRTGDTGTRKPGEEEILSASPRLPVTVSLHFAVRDTGIGIPLDRQSRLFQSFSQVDASTTRRFGGTGLGLAISRRLTELMGGTMWVESEGVAGKGSTFYFTIRAEVAQPLAPPPYLQTVQPQLEGKRVLIVDDNATNRHILSLQAQAWDMLPEDTASPHAALAWISRGDPFDVALLDLQMPEMDGIQLAAEIRRLRPEPQLPLVILSSLGQKEGKAEDVELAAYLLKPIKPSQLYNALVGIFGAEETVSAIEETAKPRFDAEMGKRHPLSILLAEDNATNQKLALLVLERLGYRADVAANGIEVLRALRRQPYDVVLMDVQMPDMDGLEATRVIGREFGDERRPRIVAMTANAMKEDRDECFAAGMDDFITKPIQLTELVAALNRCQARDVAEMNERPSPAARPEDERPKTKDEPGPPSFVPSALPVPIPPALAALPAVGGPGETGALPSVAGTVAGQALRPSSPVETGQESGATAASEPAPPVLDPAALVRLRGTLGKQADVMLPSLMDTFFKDAPKLIADAQRSWEQGQSADLRRAAHSLKSSSATFGAMALSALARELEYKARDGALEGADELLARIQAEYAQAKAALVVWRKES
jgi:PAS domain S-box-containing protein